jgi:small-conductance mechanosensitive channel
VPPLASLAFVRNNRPVVRDKAVRFVKYAAFIVWILIALNLFAVRDAIFTYLRGMLGWSLDVGSIHISVGDVIFFGIVIWVAVLVSRFVRFVLEEDVYPHVELGGGVSYAVSTMLHYALLVGAFLFAVAALGVDFTKFAIIAGAVGIGVGFGLQNIINNFVSGLILLFERPVKVGDTVQIGENIGTLKQIGLRASVLRKVDGSDVIVPNSQLISEEVTNWTMSDKNRRIDIPLGVAYGTDPNQVIDLLTEVAANNSELMAEPAPQTLFLEFGDNSLNFEFRAWTDNTDRWVKLRSELVCDIYDALNKANIEIPFPQRDLHLRSVDDDAARRITGDTRS